MKERICVPQDFDIDSTKCGVSLGAALLDGLCQAIQTSQILRAL
jgi:hypothetical protein